MKYHACHACSAWMHLVEKVLRSQILVAAQFPAGLSSQLSDEQGLDVAGLHSNGYVAQVFVGVPAFSHAAQGPAVVTVGARL